MDNDVEHVTVKGSLVPYLESSSGYRLYQTTAFAGDMPASCAYSRVEVGEMLTRPVYDCTLVYPSFLREYDQPQSWRPDPMYDEYIFIDCNFRPRLYDGLTETPRSGYVRYAHRRCFANGTVYSSNEVQWDFWTSSYPMAISPNVILCSGTAQSVDKASLYYDCLRNLPLLRRSAQTSCFQDACNGIDHIESNNIANMGQIIKLLSALFRRDVKGILEIPKTIEGWWLWYRYQYSTTKLDVKENRHLLDTMKRSVQRHTTYGVCMDTEQGVFWRCGVTTHPNDAEWIDTLSTFLYSIGLYPTAVNLWDMVPFSFIVDWFLPVGSMLESIDNAFRFDETHYTFERINYSVTCDCDSRCYKGIRYHYYRRWSESKPPIYGGWMDDYSPSARTQTKRFVDALSLIVSLRR